MKEKIKQYLHRHGINGETAGRSNSNPTKVLKKKQENY